jgi:hypothetical protein
MSGAVTVFWAVVGLLWVAGVLWLVVSEARKKEDR